MLVVAVAPARRLLEAAGWVVTEASDGEEAIALLEVRGVDVDLVLSAVVMPQMNGKALADQLRRTRAGLAVLLRQDLTSPCTDPRARPAA